MLPLGYRVQEKVERLIDRHMYSIGMLGRILETESLELSLLGASKLDLSSISSEDLWKTSGRFKKVNSEVWVYLLVIQGD
jgi:prolyl-tRNA synthetase